MEVLESFTLLCVVYRQFTEGIMYKKSIETLKRKKYFTRGPLPQEGGSIGIEGPKVGFQRPLGVLVPVHGVPHPGGPDPAQLGETGALLAYPGAG